MSDCPKNERGHVPGWNTLTRKPNALVGTGKNAHAPVDGRTTWYAECRYCKAKFEVLVRVPMPKEVESQIP